MKKILLFTITAFLTNISMAQYAGQVAVASSKGGGAGVSQAFIDKAIGNIEGHYAKLSDKAVVDDFQGSPYTSNEFKPAVMFYENDKIGEVYYRYNAYNEEVETKQTTIPGETLKGLRKDKSISILIDGSKMGFKTFIDRKGKTLNGYLTSLVENDKYNLYRRIKVTYKEGQKAQNSFVKAVPNKFTQFTEYYYQPNGASRIDEITLNNGKIINLFNGDEKVRVKNFIKENKLNLKKEKDLIKVFEFVNKT
ncbi:hypothetical protein GGR42_003251 [Saonia flava]|uniref:Uncharacterized protein n=1 Tax=Saonia flava TaxID=523696 RepID=A0A846R0S5_9FLAO|nr:hypothetical protein [Saonia flava]NJB72760.1 hypothetical protein [Saonia flava]